MLRLEAEERKKLIIEKSLELFLQVGYERTTIQRLINELGLSKGGFYHHYRSKEELLNDIAAAAAGKHVEEWRQINNRSELSATEKFVEIFRSSSEMGSANLKLTLIRWEKLYSEENHMFRRKLLQKQIEIAVPEMVFVIQEGLRDGSFDTAFPELCAANILWNNDRLMESILPLMVRAENERELIPDIFRLYQYQTDIMERMLGAEEGSLTTFTLDYFKAMLS